MSICESSSQSSDQSSESSNNNSSFKTSPELRLRPKSTSEVGTNKSTAHLSCPDLETMVTKNANSSLNSSSQCMTIPNRAIEPKKQVSETDSEDHASPLLNRRRKLHGGDVLPKFSISMEDAKSAGSNTSLQQRSFRHSLEGPKSLPVTPKCSVEPNTPSPLVICSTSFDHHGGT